MSPPLPCAPPRAAAPPGAVRAWLPVALRLAVAGVFGWSGWAKLVDPDGAVRAVRAYRLLPEAVVPAVGIGLPVLELGLALLLVVGLATRLTAVLTAVLSTAFAAGVASAWARGLRIECGCFGGGGPSADPVPGYVRELLLNAAILTAALFLLRRGAGRLSLDGALRLTPDRSPTSSSQTSSPHGDPS